MNNDSTPSTAADLPTSSENATDNTAEATEPTSSVEEVKTPAQKKAQIQAKKKNEFLGSMMEQLDLIIYVELCIVYYMDCSLFRLLLRAINQMMFLTPKPKFTPPTPKHRPYIGAIFVPNLLCILLHILTERSEAGEAMRGYLHGGLIIDLIGQKGPTSKAHLVLLDILVLALQCFMLAVHVEKDRISALMSDLSNPSSSLAAVGAEPRAAIVTAQAMDAEERGVARPWVTRHGDIEMRELEPPVAERTAAHDGMEDLDEGDGEHHLLLAGPPAQRQDEDDADTPLDMFYTGQVILADFHIMHTLRRQWEDYGRASESALQTVGFSAEFARMAANRRLTAAGQRLQRQVDSL